MNVILNKIHRENFDVEQWQQNLKKQQMRENIVKSVQMRELADKTATDNLIKKEAQINKLYSPKKSDTLNIHDNSVKKVGQNNLDAMFHDES